MSDLFPPVIETGRLRLERVHPDNVDPLAHYEVCSSDPGIEEITEHMPWEPHPHPKETLELFERQAEQWDDGESADYFLRVRSEEPDASDLADGTLAGPDDLAGQGGLRIDWERRAGTLGIWLRKPFWGRGYSGERAAAMLALAFDRLDLELVSVNHRVDNDKSRRAIEKYVDRFGGRREGVLRNYLPFFEEPRDAVRYTITAEEFAANRPDDLGVVFDP